MDAQPLRVIFPPELVEAVAERAAELVVEQLRAERGDVSELLTIREAAAWLRCKPQRIYDLRSSGRVTALSDGRRALVRRAELEALLGGETPAADLRRAA
ncbi:MAG TPA: helix-turn-helix domain-containing protein [Gaiellaceae bacterium]|nr:helix-turn-helix domain-containing protein [Gaiellaceae bacterium]